MQEIQKSVRIVFVLRNRTRDWPDLERLGECDIASQPQRFVGGRNSWIAQSYVRLAPALRERGYEVGLSDRFVPGAICIAHRDDANGFASRAADAFLVIVRADRAPVHACDLAIVQNGLDAAPHERFVPLWPQPGLLPRDASRGSAIRNLAYHGRLGSAPEWFGSKTFLRDLAARGVAFEAHATGWENYRDVDLALAARNESPRVLATKPATKLYNAWHAGVPLLAMPEPAYLEQRRSPLDFIEVRGPGDVLRAVDSLRRDRALYRALVANGLERAAEFGVQRTRDRWIALIEREVVPGFRALRANAAGRRFWHLGAMARQKVASRGHRVVVAWERWMDHPHGPRHSLDALRAAFTRESVQGHTLPDAEPSNLQR
ncbi:hypothetical protein BWI17_02950 [Betaproteobacteria bacterium GR16-43]|nr:hypothetical protein BWI17_02950 [Betaproteobacteria bacterium GR16-43]